MKNHIDTYELYRSGSFIKETIRARVIMKDLVDIDILRKSINTAIKRYPYFKKEIIIDDDGGYNLIDNNRDIVVIETNDKLPYLGSDEVNKHLFYVDCIGKEINFNFSHSLAGGKGFSPLLETCLFQYVCDRYNIILDAPSIRKPNSALLEKEDIHIDSNIFKKESIINLPEKEMGHVILGGYLNALLNPFYKGGQYYTLSFNVSDIMKYAKNNDSSVAAFFIVCIFKAMCKVLPKKAKVITAGISHNPVCEYGIDNCHSDILSHVRVRYKREMENFDNEKLGTITRSQIFLQTDPDCTSKELYAKYSNYEKLDNIKGYFKKHVFASTKCSSLKGGGGGTFIVNYTGKRDFGQLANYIDSYFFIVDGDYMSEITSMSDKLFMCFLELRKENKYIKAICKVFDENNISYTLNGPFKTNHVRVKLPTYFNRK